MQLYRHLSDTELIHCLRTGEELDPAVRFIYRNYFDSLCGYVMHNSGTRQDAEDIFQDVVVGFIDLVQKDKFRGESSVKTFLFTMNRHAWLNELKRRGRSDRREQRFEDGRDKVEPGISEAIAASESRKQVLQIVEQLGETCKKILVLFYYENRAIKEILDELDYENEQVVRNKKYKCLKQLEQLLSRQPGLKQILKNMIHE